MSISLGANGGSYSYPQENDPAGWGDDATNWASAVSAALGNIGLGGTVSATALIDMSGTTTKGFLPPKLTTVQRNSISTPPAGLVIYNTTTSQLEVYTGSSWFSVASNIDGNLTVNGNSTLNGTLTVTGTTTLNGALTVTGATSLQSVTSTGSTVNGVLSVTGNTTLVNVTGANITSTGTILAASGTSGTPGISFSGDPDTGIYNSAANQISFAVSGSEVGRVTSTYGGFKGNIIQVLQTVKSDTFSNTSTSYVDITGMSCSITPRYSTSKILVIVDGVFSSDTIVLVRLLRGATEIYSGDGANGVLHQIYTGGSSDGVFYYSPIHFQTTYLDSPATTSSTTYKLQTRQTTGSLGTMYLNRNFYDTAQYNGRTASSITLMEVQQ